MRIARLIAAAAVAASAFAVIPIAGAQAQPVCRGTRTIYTGDMVISYPYVYLC